MVLAFLFRWHTQLVTILQHKTVNCSSSPVFKWSKPWGEEGLGKRLTLTTCGAKSVSSTWHASIAMLDSSPCVASIEGMPCQINLLHIRSVTRGSASSLTTIWALAFVQLRPTRCDSHSQLIQLIDAIISNQQYGQPFTDASENVHWLTVLAWVRLPCGKHQCTCQGCHDSKEVKEIKPAEYYKAHHNNICTGAACKCYCRL